MREIPFAFTLEATRGLARSGQFQTPHGAVTTPIFMPVGTKGSVKALDSQDLENVGAEIILGNTYHLYLRPGTEKLIKVGGLHQFMNWPRPILTDSGGFQVFSLGKLAKISDEGVEFTSHLDGSRHFFSPTTAIEIQRQIGADLIMAFDQCTPDQANLSQAKVALARTHAWAERCVEVWEAHQRRSVSGQYQALFGIVQGAQYQSLRLASTQFLTGLPFDGWAMGGETIGYNMPMTVRIMESIERWLPVNKLRYAMGLGRDPQNALDAVLAGFGMFDCVGPTRLARNGALYVGELAINDHDQPYFASDFPQARLNIGQARWATDAQPIQPGCDCHTCRSGYSRAYLHHLAKSQELGYYRLATIHNLRLMLRLMAQLRDWISHA